jgi:hypothetical protein
MAKVKVLESFAGDHGSFAKGSVYTLPDAIADAYIYHSLVEIYEDKSDLPIAKLISHGKEEKKAEARKTTGQAKRKIVKRKTKKG